MAYIIVGHRNASAQPASLPTACLTPHCLKLSATVISNMNLSVDPCVDFFEYACGEYSQNTDIPPGHPTWSYFDIQGHQLKVAIKQLIETSGTEFKGQNSSALTKAKIYYDTCMNVSSTESQGIDPVLKLITDVGSCSMINDSWDPSTWDFLDVFTKMQWLGVQPLLHWKVDADDKDNSVNILQFQQGGLSLDSEKRYLSNSTLNLQVRDAWITMITKIGILLGGNEKTMRKQAQEVLEFETKLAKVYIPLADTKDPMAIYHKMPLSELQAMMPNTKLQLKPFLNKIFSKSSVTDNENVVVYMPTFFGNFTSILNATEDRILANYMIVQLLQSVVPYLPTRFEDAVLEFKTVVSGVRPERLQWEKCSSRLRSTFGFVASALYVDAYMTEKTHTEISELMDHIKKAFVIGLPQLGWMEDQTMRLALSKAANMYSQIAYPDWILKPAMLDDHYEKVNATKDEPLHNALSVMRFAVDRIIARRGQKPDKDEWQMVPVIVNAYYAPNYNHITILGGILSYPFYEEDFPRAMYYGGMGMVAGHEFTHGFDSMGSQFDQNGNMKDWWEKSTKEKFKTKSKCMKEQYDQYNMTLEDHVYQLDGKLTLAENIADNGGIKLAWTAYQRWRQGQGKNMAELTLPGLNMTHDQMFFLSAAQVWCQYSVPRAEVQRILTNPHSPHKFRVIGSFTNTPAFSEAFSCAPNAPMNPSGKCLIW
ncbi:PREDICTED: endothelin-converting enzyme 1-like [Priapulus caudatus]|uniref:Endothelin-converting enzyme 1-like n=1 Tax=Priapulus caudatus TaxID=37621 RepID=A0ABM1EZ01_PRICU|nr:PREDICTED: endothelin-converting enzyme 1-like [Priapulus caudatus]XP_014677430.1 PREDICTED: endothelin-converting enzyme 1-like [Priapulus caudatus]XP_014677439.1 PREDICTED: endothelin-converting enzyme 1-like [Priapulus caudatus]XP_014677445.1 PREDICTED: endothelin-converting enzyme 1-like [Priapulus caudatus]XP_014677452.1 PREDICTED: endothelin-converting enzyme 1-like [Priapulus caudatus]